MKTKLYFVWRAMRERCRRPETKHFDLYGGRGIAVCPDWHSYPVFQAWAIGAGYREGLLLDRRNNGGNYEPDNCRWVTVREQMRNRRSNRPVIRSDGKIYPTMIEAAEDVGCHKTAIYGVCRGKAKTANGFGWKYAHQP